MKDERWLTLKQAAERLGVHQTTLRRWANQGDIPVMLTPGGHRRFAESDVETIASAHREQQPVTAASASSAAAKGTWAERAIALTRREMAERSSTPTWVSSFSEAERAHSRAMGHRLMGLTLQYVASGEDAEAILNEAAAIGRVYGTQSRAHDLALTDALRAALFFRDALVEAAMQPPSHTAAQPEDQQRLLRRINEVLNTVQLAIAEAYETA
ncbi:MAG: helix-turn-helix domain-containing protein [Rhodothermales bacterium]